MACRSPTSTSVCPTWWPGRRGSSERREARRRVVDRHGRSARHRRHRRSSRSRARRASGSPARRRSARTQVSSPDMGRELGVLATNDKEALYALEPDCIVHTAMVDDRIFEAIADLTEMVERGINVVSSGPVLLCYPQGLGLDELRRRDRRRRGEDRRQPARQRHRPRVGQRRAAAGADLALAADRPGAGQRDRRLLDVLPARGDERHLRLRQADGPRGDALAAGDPHHRVGSRRTPDRGGSRPRARRRARGDRRAGARRPRPRAPPASTSPRAPWAPSASRSSARSTACRG